MSINFDDAIGQKRENKFYISYLSLLKGRLFMKSFEIDKVAFYVFSLFLRTLGSCLMDETCIEMSSDYQVGAGVLSLL